MHLDFFTFAAVLGNMFCIFSEFFSPSFKYFQAGLDILEILFYTFLLKMNIEIQKYPRIRLNIVIKG